MEKEYSLILIADHGNADVMINEDGSPNTAHTKNPVPVIFIPADTKMYAIKPGRLADIAPTILYVMNLHIPVQMTGDILVHAHP
jgi:2,3-bisphosphoglycerate-independent phosphoglycerate mutase